MAFIGGDNGVPASRAGFAIAFRQAAKPPQRDRMRILRLSIHATSIILPLGRTSST